MTTRHRRWTALALTAVLTVSGVACSSDDDGDGDEASPGTTTAPATTTETDGVDDGADDGEGDGTDDSAAIAPLGEVDACALVRDVDVESVVGDEAVTPTAETSPALPATLESDVDPLESTGCIAVSSQDQNAGLIVRAFRFPTADDADAAVASLAGGEEVTDTQADSAMLARITVPSGFSYTLAGSVGDVVVLVQAQSIADLTDPETHASTLNGAIDALRAA